MQSAAEDGYVKLARALLEHGAEKDASGRHGMSPLHFKSLYGHVEIAKMLLEKKARKEAVTTGGQTPLHCAVRRSHVEVGANKEAVAYNVGTPLHFAATHGSIEIATLLLEKGAKIEAAARMDGLHCTVQQTLAASN